ncbi:MAG: endonuclease/exonuclease/phosphatase family protein [Rubripirellula sp.]
MARKKSRFSILTWLLFTGVSGSGIGGYLNPDLPVVGPFVKNLFKETANGESLDRTALRESASAMVGDRLDGARQGGVPAQLASAQIPQSARAQIPARAQAGQPAPQQKSSLVVASFNIQVLGKSKLSKPGMTEKLAYILRQFDLIAIQEVRAKDDNILPELVSAINANGSRYSFIIGPRLGRTVSTEQYAFVFNTNTVEHDPTSVGTMTDPKDLLHREPFVTRFRARTQSPAQAFTFWMVNIHTDPDEVPQEIAALADVYQVMQRARADEDDVILLGDLNASEKQLGRLGQIPGMHWAISGVMTNTRQNKAYDNILFQGQATREFTGRWGVFDLERNLRISRDEALKISDHLPVWAEFQVWEAPSQPSVADRNRQLRR